MREKVVVCQSHSSPIVRKPRKRLHKSGERTRGTSGTKWIDARARTKVWIILRVVHWISLYQMLGPVVREWSGQEDAENSALQPAASPRRSGPSWRDGTVPWYIPWERTAAECAADEGGHEQRRASGWAGAARSWEGDPHLDTGQSSGGGT